MKDTRVPAPLQRFVNEKVVLLETRKRDGTWIPTPVNIAVKDDRAYFRTPARASKNKRLRNHSTVRFCPCTWRGKPTGDAVTAEARLLSPDESAAARELLDEKLPVVQGLLVPLAHRVLRTQTLHYELTQVRPA